MLSLFYLKDFVIKMSYKKYKSTKCYIFVIYKIKSIEVT